MSCEQALSNRVRACRIARGWSQDDLAARVGISRAGVSGIETNRLVPSTAAALALAAAFDCRVEDLFQLGSTLACQAAWAWQPQREPSRYWRASVAGPGAHVSYANRPIWESSDMTACISRGSFASSSRLRPRTLWCWPPAILPWGCWPTNSAAGAIFVCSPFRDPARRPSGCWRKAWSMWAGIHLAEAGHGLRNTAIAKDKLRRSVCSLRGGHAGRRAWPSPLDSASTACVPRYALGLVGWGENRVPRRRELFDELLPNRRPPRHIVYGHRGVAEAIRSGWADIGICLRLVSEEAGLDFLRPARRRVRLLLPGRTRRRSTAPSSDRSGAVVLLPRHDQ